MQQVIRPIIGNGDTPCNRPVVVGFFEECFQQQRFAGARSAGHHDKTLSLIKCVFEVFSGSCIARMAKTETRVGRKPEGISA